MTGIFVALTLALALLFGVDGASAETASCNALIKKRDAECQVMAERMEAACSGEKADTRGDQSAECRKLGEQLGGHCNRNPCGGPPKKAKAKKAKAKKGDQKGGMAGAKKAEKKAPAPKQAPK